MGISENNHPAVAFRGFSLSFARNPSDLVILEDVTLEVPAGGLVILVGASGAGKSTLLKLIAGLWESREPRPKIRGRLEVLGQDVASGRVPHRLRRRVRAVLQDEGLLDELTPEANVQLALQAIGRRPAEAQQLLRSVGLENPPRSVDRLSGGMRKRVAVARALAGEPDLLIFDEPTAGLDQESARTIAEQIAMARAAVSTDRDATTVVITHDLHAFAGLVDGVIRIDGERRTIDWIAGSEIADGRLPSGFGAAPRQGGGTPKRRIVARFLLATEGWTRVLFGAVRHLPPRFPGIALRTVLRYSIESAPFVAAGSATVGGLATFFALRNNPLEGAFVNAVLAGSGRVLIAVLVPLLAGFFFTARIAAGAAARVGTMKRTSQISALRLLGIDPQDYLLAPLVWGICVAMPVTTAVGLVAASWASFVASRFVLGSDPHAWAQSFFADVALSDMRWNLIRAITSGFLVAVTTYYLASGPKTSGRAVGESVNRSIVVGIFIVLMTHSLATLAQFG